MRINGDQDGVSEGKNLIAEIKHDFLMGHRERGRDAAPIVSEVCTEIAHGARLVVEVLEDRGDARNRAFAFQTSQQNPRFEEEIRGLDKVLGIAKEVFQVVPGGPGELIQKGSGDVILLSNLGHLTVDALMDPNVFDNVDAGLRI